MIREHKAVLQHDREAANASIQHRLQLRSQRQEVGRPAHAHSLARGAAHEAAAGGVEPAGVRKVASVTGSLCKVWVLGHWSAASQQQEAT
eukprot:186650-Chlamydomonas_euryale.AAC.1